MKKLYVVSDTTIGIVNVAINIHKIHELVGNNKEKIFIR